MSGIFVPFKEPDQHTVVPHSFTTYTIKRFPLVRRLPRWAINWAKLPRWLRPNKRWRSIFR